MQCKDCPYAASRLVVTVDLDCFYVQCALHQFPQLPLRGLPIGIQQQQLVVTCSYEARARGVGKLQPLAEARRRCPELVLVDGSDLDYYRACSDAILALFNGEMAALRAQCVAGVPALWALEGAPVGRRSSDGLSSTAAPALPGTACAAGPPGGDLPPATDGGAARAAAAVAAAAAAAAAAARVPRVTERLVFDEFTVEVGQAIDAQLALVDAATAAQAAGGDATAAGSTGRVAATSAQAAQAMPAALSWPGHVWSADADRSGAGSTPGSSSHECGRSRVASQVLTCAATGASPCGCLRRIAAAARFASHLRQRLRSMAPPLPPSMAHAAAATTAASNAGGAGEAAGSAGAAADAPASSSASAHALLGGALGAAADAGTGAAIRGFTSCAGVGTNKLAAKLAVSLHKPDAQTTLLPWDVSTYLAPLPVRAVPGVGGVAEARLAACGISRVADLLRHPADTLAQCLAAGSGAGGGSGSGSGAPAGAASSASAAALAQAQRLLSVARGIDDSPVHPTAPPASLSDETALRGLTTWAQAVAQLTALACALLPRLDSDSAQHGGRMPRSLRVGVRTRGTGSSSGNSSSGFDSHTGLGTWGADQSATGGGGGGGSGNSRATKSCPVPPGIIARPFSRQASLQAPARNTAGRAAGASSDHLESGGPLALHSDSPPCLPSGSGGAAAAAAAAQPPSPVHLRICKLVTAAVPLLHALLFSGRQGPGPPLPPSSLLAPASASSLSERPTPLGSSVVGTGRGHWSETGALSVSAAQHTRLAQGGGLSGSVPSLGLSSAAAVPIASTGAFSSTAPMSTQSAASAAVPPSAAHTGGGGVGARQSTSAAHLTALDQAALLAAVQRECSRIARTLADPSASVAWPARHPLHGGGASRGRQPAGLTAASAVSMGSSGSGSGPACRTTPDVLPQRVATAAASHADLTPMPPICPDAPLPAPLTILSLGFTAFTQGAGSFAGGGALAGGLVGGAADSGIASLLGASAAPAAAATATGGQRGGSSRVGVVQPERRAAHRAPASIAAMLLAGAAAASTNPGRGSTSAVVTAHSGPGGEGGGGGHSVQPLRRSVGRGAGAGGAPDASCDVDGGGDAEGAAVIEVGSDDGEEGEEEALDAEGTRDSAGAPASGGTADAAGDGDCACIIIGDDEADEEQEQVCQAGSAVSGPRVRSTQQTWASAPPRASAGTGGRAPVIRAAGATAGVATAVGVKRFFAAPAFPAASTRGSPALQLPTRTVGTARHGASSAGSLVLPAIAGARGDSAVAGPNPAKRRRQGQPRS
jgi:nucleotidyltransferase/DNA polymerase involved in DNA repair